MKFLPAVSPIIVATTVVAIAASVRITVAVLLSCIHRAIQPKGESHDQTSNHKSSNYGGNIQVGSNHSLLFGFVDDSNLGILLTLGGMEDRL